MSAAEQRLEDRLRRAWLAELARRWALVNQHDLQGRLKPPVFALHDGKARLGTWFAQTRTLSLSAAHIARSTWIEINETLRHEMAHQVVSELFTTTDSSPHGSLFQRACKMLHIEGSPRLDCGFDPDTERILRRVQKLMNLSSSDNPHEARAAAAAANRLLLTYNLEIDQFGCDDYGYRWLGPPAGRVPTERKLLASILQEYYFVRCIWIRTTLSSTGKPASMLEVLGRHANLDIAEYVHSALLGHLDALWQRFRQESSPPRAARRSFRVGVLMGFRETLGRVRQSCAEQGLIWVGDPGVGDFFRRRYPRISKLSGGGYYDGNAHQAGKAAGKAIRIRSGVAGDAGERKGLLTTLKG